MRPNAEVIAHVIPNFSTFVFYFHNQESLTENGRSIPAVPRSKVASEHYFCCCCLFFSQPAGRRTPETYTSGAGRELSWRSRRLFGRGSRSNMAPSRELPFRAGMSCCAHCGPGAEPAARHGSGAAASGGAGEVVGHHVSAASCDGLHARPLMFRSNEVTR